MNQRIAVRAIIRVDEKVLLLKRATGRPSILGKYELPGGQLKYGEQPEDALQRYIQADIGVAVKVAQLFDVLTYIDHDDRDLQYVIILYLVSVEAGKLQLGAEYSHYQWQKMADIHQEELTESSKLLLGISQQTVIPQEEKLVIKSDVTSVSDANKLIVYSDGGSRGNPGPSAAGFVIMNADEHVIHEGGMYLGVTTNNVAEYQGVRLGLEKAQKIGARVVDFRVDSMLVANQMNGLYTIKNRELWPIHERIVELIKQFDKVTFTHVKREFNQLADGMVNKILNAHGSSENGV
jgi:mutator protein MutT